MLEACVLEGVYRKHSGVTNWLVEESSVYVDSLTRRFQGEEGQIMRHFHASLEVHVRRIRT